MQKSKIICSLTIIIVVYFKPRIADVAWLVVLILLTTLETLQAQRTVYRNGNNHIWEKATEAPKVKSKFLDSDVVYLIHETEYEINKRTPPTGTFGNLRSRGSTIKKRILAQVVSEKGKDTFAKFVLPESINHYTSDYNGMASRQHTFNDAKHLDVEVQYFAARLINENATTKRLEVKDKVLSTPLGRLGEPHRTIEYQFQIEGITVGDVVEVEYEVFVPQPLGFPIIPAFNEQMTDFYTAPGFYYWWRFFFHQPYPVQESKTTFSFFNELSLEWQYYNNAQPDSIINTKVFNKHIWQHSDLEATNFDINSKAYQHLPNVHFYYHNQLYGNTYDGGRVNYKPYTWDFLCQNVLQFKGENDVTSSQFSLKERLLNKFYAKHEEEFRDKPIKILQSMHHAVLDDFTYINNENHYFGRDITLYDTGRALRNVRIHEKNRFNVYDGLLRRLKQNYFLVFVPDSRVAQIDENRPIVPLNPIMLYAVQFENTLVYVMPKHKETGFFLDELPFFV